MKNLFRKLREANADHEEAVHHLIRGEIAARNSELNEVVSKFCSDVCELYDAPNNDYGPLNSEFCSKLEREVVKKIHEWVREKEQEGEL